MLKLKNSTLWAGCGVAGVLLSPVMICCVLCSARRVAAGQLSRDLLTARPAPAATTETTTETEERGQHRDIPGKEEAF